MHFDRTFLEQKARQIRKDIVSMTAKAGSGHPGGSLSAADIAAVLYGAVLRHDPQRPDWSERDRFFLSKGHACPVLYAVLAEWGYFPKEQLDTLRQFGSILQGHPCMHSCPGVEVSAGSLGQGLSIATGAALGAKLDGTAQRMYCLMGDGELDEGSVWEAAMCAAHHKLDNLCAIVDNNGLQIDGKVEDVMSLEPLADKWRAFGWNTLEVDGHDVGALAEAFEQAAQTKGKPTVLICKTVKGKGVSFMENNPAWHGKAPSGETLEKALSELEGN